MFQQKTPKREAPDSADIIMIANPMDRRLDPDQLKQQPSITFASVDPATDNFAFRIERRYNDPFGGPHCSKIETCVFEVSRFRREAELPDGTMEPRSAKAKAAVRAATKKKKKSSLVAEPIKGKVKISHLYKDIENYLNRHREHLAKCDILVIERQVVINYVAIRVQQHVIAYFSLNYPHVLVMDQSSTLKTQQLGAPPHLNKKGTKLWSIEEGRCLLQKRGDDLGLARLKATKNKLDDMTDTVVQVEAFCIAVGLPITDPNQNDLQFILDPDQGPSSSQPEETLELYFD